MKNTKLAVFALGAVCLFAVNSGFAQSGGEATYKAKCQMCHGATGAGDTTMGKNLKIRDLGSADVQKQSDAELDTVITKGKGKMPAYDGKLTKEQIGELVKYIRTLKK